jgi:hypothetical protein
MGINYKRIIREEISRLILSEVIDTSPLAKYIQPLQKCVSDLRNMGYSNNKEIDAFLKDVCEYILQVIFGIDRCVKANSLNEDFRLSDYGVQYPSELGSNLWNDFENGLYKGANWARNQLYKRGKLDKGNGTNNKENTLADDNNPNSVPSVKLEESLRNLPQISLRYQDLTNKYHNIMSQYSNAIYDALSCISSVNNDFRQIKANAQGNP